MMTDDMALLSRVPPKDEPTSAPLSFIQERLWVLDQLEPDNPAYMLGMLVDLSGQLNIAALRQSLAVVVGRHAVLRTSIVVVDEQPRQVIVPAGAVAIELPLLDLSALPAPERMLQVQALTIAEARRPFDLAHGPLLRVRLLRLEANSHVLLLVLHQIIGDQRSLAILSQEIATLYDDFAQGQNPTFLEPPRQYIAIAAWQREQLQGELLAEQLAYWQAQLADPPGALELPTDRPRTAAASKAARLPLVLPPALTVSLRVLSQRECVPLFVTLLAAFQTLLYRYSGQEDILVGTPVDGRRHAEAADVLGPLTDTLVLRGRLRAELFFHELLAQVHTTVEGARTHQDIPFARLAVALRPRRDLDTPLFQVLFALHEVPVAGSPPGAPAFSHRELAPVLALHDLGLVLADDRSQLRGWLEYNADLFDTTTIARLSGHFLVLLESIVANAQQRLADLTILTDDERRMLLIDWNRTESAYPIQGCIQALFEAQVARIPHNLAVIGTHQRLSYSELNRRANQLAHYLRRQHIGPETRVGICVERGPAMLVGLLAILKAGAAFVPLDPSFPPERLAFMLEDSRATMLITQEEMRHWKLEIDPTRQSPTIVYLDRDWPIIAQERDDNLQNVTTPDSPAYLIYTSGSTGTPKGVVGLHRGTLNRCQWMWATYPFTEGEICCQKTALSFVDSIWEVFGPLLRGIPLVVIPDEIVKDPAQLVDLLAERRVTRIVLVPTLLRVILEMHVQLECRLPHLKYCVTSGEALPLEMSRRFHEQMPHCALLNLYGSSEVAADATWHDTGHASAAQSVPIGRPIANTQIYILDHAMRPVPVGVPGELYVGGENLARGYFNRPDLTAERFVPSPWSVVRCPLPIATDNGPLTTDNRTLQNGRPGALPARRHDRVFGPPRSADQASRSANRVGRDRSGAGAARGRARGSRPGPRGCAGGQALGGLYRPLPRTKNQEPRTGKCLRKWFSVLGSRFWGWFSILNSQFSIPR